MTKNMMTSLKGKIQTYNLFAFDIETTGNNNDFLMGSIVGDGQELVFWDKEEMIKTFLNNSCFYYKSRIMATNLSFDLTALFSKTNEMKRMDILLRGSQIIQAKLPIDTRQRRLFDNDSGFKPETEKEIIFWDTMNFYPFSVKAMGKIVGLEKLDMPLYIKEKRKPRENERNEVEKYNIMDSKISLAFSNFIQESFNQMGCRMRMTSASSAMDLFKRQYLDKPMYQEPLENMEMEFKAYYGGRVEVFKRGLVKDMNYYDFNSLYPSVMCNEYPNVSYAKHKEKGSMDIIDCYHGISEVEIECPKNLNMPFLPFRMKDKLIFPTGIFKGWYSHIELRYAMTLGYDIRKIGNQIYFTHSHRPFKEYVEALYNIRMIKKENNDPTELVIKILMNSLYGKFGQKIHGKEKMFHMDSLTEEDIVKLKSMGEITNVGEFLFFSSTTPEYISTHIMPIYALYTTAYGRIKLYEAMKKVEVIYIDTDSIITPDHIRDSKELGELKLEHKIIEGIFIKPKMYGIKLFEKGKDKSIVRIKGNLSYDLDERGDRKYWDYERYKKFINNPTVIYNKFATFKIANRKHIPFNTILNLEKTFSLEDTKRLWNEPFNPKKCLSSTPINI